MKRLIPTLVSLTLLAACAQGPVPVVIDTDMGSDDIMGLLYLLRHPGVSVKAITVSGTGLAHCEPGVRNALGLLALTGSANIPVACGRDTPLEGNHAFPSDWRDSADTTLGVPLPAPTASASSQTAAQLLRSTIEGAPQNVTLLTLGPLTNVAEALQADRSLASRLAAVWIMGGAVSVEGNIQSSGVPIDNSVAEWNIYLDPHAAAQVFAAVSNPHLVPLDATNHVPVTSGFFDRLHSDHSTPTATYVHDLLAAQQDYIASGQFFFWDALASVALTDGKLVTFQAQKLTVTETEGPQSGRLSVSDSGGLVQVGSSADAARFETLFLDTLNGRTP